MGKRKYAAKDHRGERRRRRHKHHYKERRRHRTPNSSSSSESNYRRYHEDKRGMRCSCTRDREAPGRLSPCGRSPRRRSRSSSFDSYDESSSSSRSSSYSHSSSYETSPRHQATKRRARSRSRSARRDDYERSPRHHAKKRRHNSREAKAIIKEKAGSNLIDANDATTPQKELKIDETLLSAMGPRLTSKIIRAAAIPEEARIRMKEIAAQGLPAEERKQLEEKYAIPENCLFIEAAKLNVEIKSLLPNPVASRDDRLAEKQSKLAIAIAALSSLTARSLVNEELDNVDKVSILSDCCKILIDAQREESLTRRALILPHLNLSVREYIEKETTVDEWFFGDNSEEKLRAAKSRSTAAKQLIKEAPKSYDKESSKNSKRPLRISSRIRKYQDTKSLGGAIESTAVSETIAVSESIELQQQGMEPAEEQVLDAVQGFELTFDELPYQKNPPKQTIFSSAENNFIEKHITELLSKGCIVRCRSKK
ncbi:hypothetical protein TKK_0016071 [Trichogramma kaykai]